MSWLSWVSWLCFDDKEDNDELLLGRRSTQHTYGHPMPNKKCSRALPQGSLKREKVEAVEESHRRQGECSLVSSRDIVNHVEKMFIEVLVMYGLPRHGGRHKKGVTGSNQYNAKAIESESESAQL